MKATPENWGWDWEVTKFTSCEQFELILKICAFFARSFCILVRNFRGLRMYFFLYFSFFLVKIQNKYTQLRKRKKTKHKKIQQIRTPRTIRTRI